MQNLSPSQRLYEALRATLAQAPHRLSGAWTWCVAGAVDAVSIPLPGAAQATGVHLWLGPDAIVRDLPSRLEIDGTQVPLLRQAHRPRPHIQAATAFNQVNDSGVGIVTGLVRDRLHPERLYALSCAHVFGGTAAVQVGNAIRIRTAGADGLARLVDWTPGIGAEVYRTGIDAAIARVDDPALLNALQALPQPKGISSEFHFDHTVRIQASTVKSGLLKTRWSGYVDLESTERTADYFLEDAIGYRADPPTEAGDSGAAVWDEQDRLLGVHCAAPVGDERWRSNAVFCPIDRIMDWFDVEPLASGGTAQPLAARAASSAPAVTAGAGPLPGSAAGDIDAVAKTLWGEARGEGLDGMRAVACVIGNRTARKWQRQIGFAAICHAKWQFSCWNSNDPNRARLDTIDRHPNAEFAQAIGVARALVAGQLADFTFGATHYYATSLRQRPGWAVGKNPCFQSGGHLFFNDIP